MKEATGSSKPRQGTLTSRVSLPSLPTCSMCELARRLATGNSAARLSS